MLALQKTEPAFGLRYRDVPQTGSPAPGEVIIAVDAVGVCGTDVHIYEWTGGYDSMTQAMPVTIGHEFAGTIAAVGTGVQRLRAGTRVAIRPSLVCGQCANCRRGDSDNCTQRKGIGVMRDGGLAAFVRVPASNCIVVPDAMPIEFAALTEPMTVCAEAVDNASIRPGDRLLVLGLGNIGQGSALFARGRCGSRHRRQERRAASRKPAPHRLLQQQHDRSRRALDRGGARAASGGRQVRRRHRSHRRAARLAAGTRRAEEARHLRRGGHPAEAGDGQPHAARARAPADPRLVRERQQIRGSYRSPTPTWQRGVDFLAANTDLAREMISHRLPLEKAVEGLELSRIKSASKVIVIQ